MNYSMILRKAKANLSEGPWDDREHSICFAIEQIPTPFWAFRTRARQHQLRQWVFTMLGGAPTYALWLARHHGYRKFTPQEVQEQRHRWLDELIAYLEERGL